MQIINKQTKSGNTFNRTLVVRLRANEIMVTMEDLMPIEILQRFWFEYTREDGFGGVRTLIEDFPTGS